MDVGEAVEDDEQVPLPDVAETAAEGEDNGTSLTDTVGVIAGNETKTEEDRGVPCDGDDPAREGQVNPVISPL